MCGASPCVPVCVHGAESPLEGQDWGLAGWLWRAVQSLRPGLVHLTRPGTCVKGRAGRGSDITFPDISKLGYF